MTTLQTIMAWLTTLYARHEGVMNLFGAAAVINMPRIVKRTSPFGVMYGWLYDTLQSFLGSIKPHPQQEAQPEPAPTFPESDPATETADGK